MNADASFSNQSVIDYQNGELCVESISLAQIAQQFGTPCYVYSRNTIEQAYLSYQSALQLHSHMICYAVKANANLAVLNLLAKLGSGFDIVSVGELERVLMAGGDPQKIVFSGVGKREDEIKRALEVGIYCFNVESHAELDHIQQVAAQLNRIARVSMRVNPNVDAKTHPYISTGLKENKFGIENTNVLDIYKKAQTYANIDIVGIDCHIGSQLLDVSPFYETIDYLLAKIDELDKVGIKLSHIDIGGGLGVDYQTNRMLLPQEYLTIILQKISNKKLKLLVEPGRSIVAHAGVLLTKVEYIKCQQEKNFAIVDCAMNDYLRPALYDAWQQVLPVKQNNNVSSKQYDIVGPVCETGDFMAKDRNLALASGDLLALTTVGAYGFSMASNYNARNRVAEVLVDKNKAYLIRSRETIADQVAGESLIPL